MLDRSIIIFLVTAGLAGTLWVMRNNWKRYLLLYIISSFTGNLICYTFTSVGLYTFPYIPFHGGLIMPVGIVATVFPFIVLIGVRFAPDKWAWRIPFYWAVVHLGVLGEVILKYTAIFKFNSAWDLWDSYTIWWIYLLLFDILGRKIVPLDSRKPIPDSTFRYGNWGWIIIHVILIATIFLAGVYTGMTLFK
ncbi:hypothetical protein AM500_16535 [Bacillus sp. FJAT-18017]|uniref:CBO0543 family protein n=1 Tax=Bacillus sp. FJAT-18017 TaxID=1705566 RepID=UPI0006B00B88|nr:CBO0543 family protein [Bacillus sp. FJAT-18017]ALC91226.1 hypothetical protein AM500_16535 [Bacillus sp. FJAT-18017]